MDERGEAHLIALAWTAQTERMGAPIDALRGRCYTRPRCGKGKPQAAGHGAPPNRAFAHVTFRRNRSQEAMMSRKHG